MNESLQQQMLMAQMNKKRALREKYLGSRTQQAPSPLAELVMTNVMLLAVRNRIDIYRCLKNLEEETGPVGNGTLLDVMARSLDRLTECLECSAAELFIRDDKRAQVISERVIREIARSGYDHWEKVYDDPDGSAGFELPHFDYFYQMTDDPVRDVSLYFKRRQGNEGPVYGLLIGPSGTKETESIFPAHALLMETDDGLLKQFTEKVLAGTAGLAAKEKIRLNALQAEAEKLADLCQVMEEMPEGLNYGAFFKGVYDHIAGICSEEKAVFDSMPQEMRSGKMGETIRERIIFIRAAMMRLEDVLKEKDPGSNAGLLIDQLNEAAGLLAQCAEL